MALVMANEEAQHKGYPRSRPSLNSVLDTACPRTCPVGYGGSDDNRLHNFGWTKMPGIAHNWGDSPLHLSRDVAASVLDSSKSRVASDCNLKLQGESLVSLNSDMGPIVHK